MATLINVISAAVTSRLQPLIDWETYRDQSSYYEQLAAESKLDFILSASAFGLIALATATRHFVGRLYSYPKNGNVSDGGWVAFEPSQRLVGRIAVVAFSATAALLGAFALLTAISDGRFLDGGPRLYTVILSAAACISGSRLTWREARSLLLTLFPPVRGRVNPAILFLRSFEDDDLPAQPVSPAAISEHLFPFPSLRTVEEVVLSPAKEHGAVVSLHNRGTPSAGFVHSIGASDYNWKDKVEDLAQNAHTIVILIGRTDGLAWEVELIARLNALRKAIFFVPPVSIDEQARRWHWLLETLEGTAQRSSVVASRAALDRALAEARSDGESEFRPIALSLSLSGHGFHVASRSGVAGYRELASATLGKRLQAAN